MIDSFQRREFLAFGAALPLALTSARIRASEHRVSPPKRVIFICNSLGFYRPNFLPKEKGDLRSSHYLRGLGLHDKMTVFENLYHPGMETSNHDSEKSFLTGAPQPEAAGFTNTVSLDQVLAKSMGGDTRFPYLSFSIYDRGWGCSWNEQGAPIPPLHDEEQIFRQMFRDEDLVQKRQQFANDERVLTSLKRDVELLAGRGGNVQRLNQYRALIEELETQLKHDRFWLNTRKPSVEYSLNQGREFAFSTKIQNLFELAKLAFRTDSTRVITLSMDWIYGAINVPGATGGWHTMSHHGGREETLEQLSHVESDIMKHFGQFLKDLDGIQEGNGSLLDRTTVVLGSNFGDASNHTCHQLPILIAGGGYQHRQYHALDQPTPLSNLWLELLHRHQIDVGEFGGGHNDMSLLGVP